MSTTSRPVTSEERSWAEAYQKAYAAGHAAATCTAEKRDVERLRLISDLVAEQKRLKDMIYRAQLTLSRPEYLETARLIDDDQYLQLWLREASTLLSPYGPARTEVRPPSFSSQKEIDQLVARLKATEQGS